MKFFKSLIICTISLVVFPRLVFAADPYVQFSWDVEDPLHHGTEYIGFPADDYARGLNIDFTGGSFSGVSEQRYGKLSITHTYRGNLDPGTQQLQGTFNGSGENHGMNNTDGTPSLWQVTFSGNFTTSRVRSFPGDTNAITKDTKYAEWTGPATIVFSKVSCSRLYENDPQTCPVEQKVYIGNILMKADSQFFKNAPEAGSSIAPENVSGAVHVLNITGDVEYSHDGGKTYLPLTPEVILQKGDLVSTGLRSSASLDFGYGQLTIFKTTTFHLDEFVSRENLQKTQVFLRTGSIEAKIIHHTAAIRSDLHVATPTATASIRGSAMTVSYDDTAHRTTVTTTEDVSYVQGMNDASETIVPQGQQAQADSAGKVGALMSATPSSLDTGGLKVFINQTPIFSQVFPGAKGAKVMNIALDASASKKSLIVTQVSFVVDSNKPLSALIKNCHVYQTFLSMEADITGNRDIVSAATDMKQSPNDISGNYEWHYIVGINRSHSIVLPPGSKATIEFRCDISASAPNKAWFQFSPYSPDINRGYLTSFGIYHATRFNNQWWPGELVKPTLQKPYAAVKMIVGSSCDKDKHLSTLRDAWIKATSAYQTALQGDKGKSVHASAQAKFEAARKAYFGAIVKCQK